MRMVKKYIDSHEDDIPEEKQTVHGREHTEAAQKVLSRMERIKALRKTGLSITEIAQKTGFTTAIIKNYLSSDFSPINGHYGIQHEGKLEPFRNEESRWKAQGLTYREIHARISAKGYCGTQDAIQRWIIGLIYNPSKNNKGISPKQLAAIFRQYSKRKN